MDHFDISYLQSTSVGIVTQFLEKKGSLDELISKKAEEDRLNPDQIKRVIEASNTLAFLKTLQSSEDRTQEFPVASFKGVMDELTPPLQKEAKLSDKELVKYKTLAKRKKQERLNAEHMAMLKKAVLQTSQELERDVGFYKEAVTESLKLRDSLRKEPGLFEKVAHLGYVDRLEEFVDFIGVPLEKSGAFLTGSDKAKIQDHYAKYCELADQIEGYHTKAAFVNEALEKSAGIFGVAGTLVRKAIAKPVVGLAKATVSGIKNSVVRSSNFAKSYASAAKFGMQNNMKVGDAITHLSDPVNASVAKTVGFNPQHIADAKAASQKMWKNMGTATKVGFAGLAASSMTHNPNNQIKGL